MSENRSFSSAEIEPAAGLDRGLSYRDLISGAVYEYSGGQWHSEGTLMALDASSTLVLKPINALYSSTPLIADGVLSATVKNDSDASSDVILYAAEYDDSGRIKDVKMQKQTVQPGSTELTIEMPNAQRAFIWDENMIPLERK